MSSWKKSTNLLSEGLLQFDPYRNVVNSVGSETYNIALTSKSDCKHIAVYNLTLKHRETHGCVVSTVATDALVLKHQAISIHNAD